MRPEAPTQERIASVEHEKLNSVLSYKLEHKAEKMIKDALSLKALAVEVTKMHPDAVKALYVFVEEK